MLPSEKDLKIVGMDLLWQSSSKLVGCWDILAYGSIGGCIHMFYSFGAKSSVLLRGS